MRLNDLIAKGLPKRRRDGAAAPVPILETVGPLTKQRGERLAEEEVCCEPVFLL